MSAPAAVRPLWFRAARLLARLLAGFLGLILAYALAALVLGALPVNTDYRHTPGGVEIFVGSNGVHTDLVLPVMAQGIDWRTRLPVEAWKRLAPDAFLSFGWGDRKFFLETPTWGDLTFSTAVRALSGTSPSLMHVEDFGHPVPGPRMRRLILSPEAYQRLVQAVDADFARDANGRPQQVPGAHYRATDAFFEAHGHYSMFLTCNEWTRRHLSNVGVRVPRWAPLEQALMHQLPTD